MLKRLTVNRRIALRNGGAVLLGAATGLPIAASALAAEDSPSLLRFGLITDLHYADRAPAGSRHYRETLDKLAEANSQFKTDKPRFVVELGDFIDAADSVAAEQAFLKRVHAAFTDSPGKKHHVLGNHCVYTLTKQEFLDGVGQKKSFYSFDEGDFHFVVLDSCFRSDGKPYGRKNFVWTDPNIPAHEVEWLEADMKSNSKPTIVFAHQRLDVGGHYGVKNAPRVRQILEQSKRVLAVFQGHSHANDHKLIKGVHYCTLVAMVEGSGAKNNSYATVDLLPEGAIRLNGHRKQKDYEWK